MVTPSATVTATPPTASASVKAATPNRVQTNLPLVVDVKFVPKAPKTPPKFIVNGKEYTITSYRYRKPGSEEWVTLNLTDLDDAGLTKLADACGKLAGEMLQKGQTPHTITLNFERVHSSPSWYHRTNGLLMNLLFKYRPEPLILKEITTKDTPKAAAVTHKFDASNHPDVEGALADADSAEYTILQNLPPPRKKHHAQKQNNSAPAQNSGTPAKTEPSKPVSIPADGNCLF